MKCVVRRASRYVIFFALALAIPINTVQLAAASGPDPAGTLYVADLNAPAIDIFAAGASGNVAPIRRIDGPGPSGGSTGLSGPGDVAVDSAGDVYAANATGQSITEYAPGASGNVAPIKTIQGSNTGLENPDDMALGADGTLYVANTANQTLLVFAPGASGNAAPVRSISGNLTGLTGDIDGLGTDATGALYASDVTSNSILVFAPGANGNVAPVRTIAGANTGLSGPSDVKVDFSGSIDVTNETGPQSFEVFNAGASGNVAPARRVTGLLTGFMAPDDLAVAPDGTAYITDKLANKVDVIGPGQSGNVAPQAVISGNLTTFQKPEGAALAPPTSPSVTTSPAASSINLTDSTSDTATITGDNPSGQMVFELYGPNDSTCSKAPAFTSPAIAVSGNGNYGSGSFTPVSAGSYSWVAEYSGDNLNAPVTTACDDPAETVTVGPQSPTLTTSTSTSINLGDPTFDAATITGSNPTGSIVFNLYGPSDPTCANLPAYTSSAIPVTGNGSYDSPDFSPIAAGSYHWIASYDGDTNNGPAVTSCNDPNESVDVIAPTPALTTSTTNSITIGQSVLDTATITGTDPSGSIVFNLYGPADSTCANAPAYTSPDVAIAGNGSYNSPSFTPTSPGTYSWVASYGGDDENGAATTSCSDPNETVNVLQKTPKLTTSTAASIDLGASTFDTALITGTNPTGSIVFSLYGPNDSSCAKSPVFTSSSVTVSGDGLYSSPDFIPTMPGTYSWVASYGGDADNLGVTTACTDAGEQVSVNALNITGHGNQKGKRLTLIWNVSGGPPPVSFSLTGLTQRGMRVSFDTKPITATNSTTYTFIKSPVYRDIDWFYVKANWSSGSKRFGGFRVRG